MAAAIPIRESDEAFDDRYDNPWELLDVHKYPVQILATASKSQIERYYRQRALAIHPDKNRDNPFAVQNFLKLVEAKDYLLG